jgi:hypothetical protein
MRTTWVDIKILAVWVAVILVTFFYWFLGFVYVTDYWRLTLRFLGGWRDMLVGAGLIGFGIMWLLYWQRGGFKDEDEPEP